MAERRPPATGSGLPAAIAAPDGYPLHYAHYPTAGETRGLIVALHGIQSHAGWYEQSCRWFADAGYETFFVERRGSGQNRRERGHCRDPRQLRDDVIRAVESVRELRPGAPTTLLAISWGAKLAVAALESRPDLVDAAVFLAPGWFAKVAPSLRVKGAILWSALLWPCRKLPIPLSDPTLFTANPRWQAYLREDADSLHRASARLLFSSWLLDRVIATAPERIGTPSLLVLAGRDRIIDNDKTRAFFARFASPEKETLEYPEAHHTLEFEPEPRPIFDDIIGWLDNRHPGGRSGRSSC